MAKRKAAWSPSRTELRYKFTTGRPLRKSGLFVCQVSLATLACPKAGTNFSVVMVGLDPTIHTQQP